MPKSAAPATAAPRPARAAPANIAPETNTKAQPAAERTGIPQGGPPAGTPAGAPPAAPAAPPGMTPSLARRWHWVASLERAFAAAEGDDESERLHLELKAATLALAREPAFTPADSAAKLRCLLTGLREELYPEDPERLTWYLLAETALAGLDGQLNWATGDISTRES